MTAPPLPDRMREVARAMSGAGCLMTNVTIAEALDIKVSEAQYALTHLARKKMAKSQRAGRRGRAMLWRLTELGEQFAAGEFTPQTRIVVAPRYSAEALCAALNIPLAAPAGAATASVREVWQD